MLNRFLQRFLHTDVLIKSKNKFVCLVLIFFFFFFLCVLVQPVEYLTFTDEKVIFFQCRDLGHVT